MTVSRVGGGLVALIVCAISGIAAETPSGVALPVTVTDSLNRVVWDLDPSAFHVFEDKVEQKVSMEKDLGPHSLGIIFDSSGSMGGRLDEAREAVKTIFGSVSNGPDDEAFLITVGDRPNVEQTFTRDVRTIEDIIAERQAKGRTPLYDAIYLGLVEMKKAKNARKALVVISDGQNVGSRYTQAEVARLENESDVQVYSIVILHGPGARNADDIDAVATLGYLSDISGGRSFAASQGDSGDAVAKIGLILSEQYVLRYQPINTKHDGTFRRITVKLTPPRDERDVRAVWKTGYYAPTQ